MVCGWASGGCRVGGWVCEVLSKSRDPHLAGGDVFGVVAD